MGFISGTQGWFNNSKSNMIYQLSRIKYKDHIILSTDAKKTLDKIQHFFRMRKALSKSVTKRTYLSIIKATYDKTPVKIILNIETLKYFPLDHEKDKDAHPTFFDIVLEVLARAILST